MEGGADLAAAMSGGMSALLGAIELLGLDAAFSAEEAAAFGDIGAVFAELSARMGGLMANAGTPATGADLEFLLEGIATLQASMQILMQVEFSADIDWSVTEFESGYMFLYTLNLLVIDITAGAMCGGLINGLSMVEILYYSLTYTFELNLVMQFGIEIFIGTYIVNTFGLEDGSTLLWSLPIEDCENACSGFADEPLLCDFSNFTSLDVALIEQTFNGTINDTDACLENAGELNDAAPCVDTETSECAGIDPASLEEDPVCISETMRAGFQEALDNAAMPTVRRLCRCVPLPDDFIRPGDSEQCGCAE
jgi:hypothetical protein